MTKHEHDIQISRTQTLPFDLKIFLKFEVINEYGILFSITQTLFFPSLCLGFKITWLKRANGSHIACVSHAWHPTHTQNIFSRFLRENEQCETQSLPFELHKKTRSSIFGPPLLEASALHCHGPCLFDPTNFGPCDLALHTLISSAAFDDKGSALQKNFDGLSRG